MSLSGRARSGGKKVLRTGGIQEDHRGQLPLQVLALVHFVAQLRDDRPVGKRRRWSSRELVREGDCEVFAAFLRRLALWEEV